MGTKYECKRNKWSKKRWVTLVVVKTETTNTCVHLGVRSVMTLMVIEPKY